MPIVLFQTAATQYPKGTILALSKIPSVVAIKDASFNVDNTVSNINEAKAASRRIGVLTGSDTFVLEAMLMGCDGALIGLAAPRRPARAHAGACPARECRGRV